MSTAAEPVVIDVDKLLAPVSEDNPVGVELGKSVMIAEIEERRKSILGGVNEATEPGMEVDQSALVAMRKSEWRDMERQLISVFPKGKDLQVCVALVEAAVNRAGWPAIAQGFRLVREAQQQYWETLYPQADLEDPDGPYLQRLTLLERLDQDSRLPLAIRQILVTDARADKDYSWADYRQAEMLRESKPGKDENADERRAMVEEKFRVIDVSVTKTSLAYYERLFGYLDAAASEMDQLIAFIDEKYSEMPEADRPNFRNIRSTLDECRNLATRFFRKKGGKFPHEIEEESAGTGSEEQGEAGSGGGGGGVFIGGDVTEILGRALSQMRAREKHNPAVYLIEEAIRWSRMPIGQWYLEASSDPHMSGFISKLMSAEAGASSETTE